MLVSEHLFFQLRTDDRMLLLSVYSGRYPAANMLLFFLIVGGWNGLCGAEHETLCTSDACFTLHRDSASFKEAHDSCVDRGGYLMTVRDGREEDVLRLLASQVRWQPVDSRGLVFYIGLKLHKGDCVHAEKTLKGFKWVSGDEGSHYSNWEKEPAATCSERCVRVRYTPPGQLTWVPGPCRHKSYYACKFYFRGMCKALTLLGRGKIKYTAVFSREPLRSKMESLPYGTLATITCSDGRPRESVCLQPDVDFEWSDPGPFCQAENESCEDRNGGCEHRCRQDAGGVRCSCDEGHDLDEDGFSCNPRDPCAAAPCQHRCVSGESGYSCECPEGFRLGSDRRNCSDVDECRSGACGDQVCVNTHGGYRCECRRGYQMVEGECGDVDECALSECEHGCLNTPGSFSCRCDAGFVLAEDGRSCSDVDECLGNPCDSECVNTAGGFSCGPTQGLHLDATAPTRAPDAEAATSHEPAGAEERRQVVTEPSSELQQQASARTEAPLPHLVNATQGDPQSSGGGGGGTGGGTGGGNDTSPATSFAKMVNSRVIICVLGSVIPLLFLISVTLAIAVYRCSRSRKEAKKKTTTDGYCWVSSGLDPRLEKLYESILTDDL